MLIPRFLIKPYQNDSSGLRMGLRKYVSNQPIIAMNIIIPFIIMTRD